MRIMRMWKTCKRDRWKLYLWRSHDGWAPRGSTLPFAIVRSIARIFRAIHKPPTIFLTEVESGILQWELEDHSRGQDIGCENLDRLSYVDVSIEDTPLNKDVRRLLSRFRYERTDDAADEIMKYVVVQE